MGESRQSSLNLNSLLAAVEAAPPVAAVDVLAGALAEAIDAREVSFLIADFSGHSLIRLGHSGGEGALRLQGKETAERVPLVGTPHGRALAAQAVEVVAEDCGARLFAPVTSRGEAVGVLELGLDDFPVEQTVADVALAAHFLAYVVIANRRYTDLFEWGQRSVPLSLAAEIQHRLLPGAFTCEAGQFTLAAWLQPAGEIGGDTFDFSLERDTLHVSMTDAMGHTMDAALLATVLVGGLRNARRRGVELAEQARLANDALAEQAGEGQFVTGLVVRIDLDRATASIGSGNFENQKQIQLQLQGPDSRELARLAERGARGGGAGAGRGRRRPLDPRPEARARGDRGSRARRVRRRDGGPGGADAARGVRRPRRRRLDRPERRDPRRVRAALARSARERARPGVAAAVRRRAGGRLGAPCRSARWRA